MIFRQFLLDVNESNAYILACSTTHEAILIDAGAFDMRIVDFLEEQRLKLTAIFITHNHYDHTDGLPEAMAHFPHAAVYRRHAPPNSAAIEVVHGSQIYVGILTGTVLETPGHTRDSISITFPGIVFTGDALFAGSVGGTNSSAEAKRQIDHLKQNILTLPETYEIHSGHGPASTIKIEKNHNPFWA